MPDSRSVSLLWLPDRPASSKAELVEALRHAAVDGADRLRMFVRQPRWIIGTGRWEAVCSYDLEISDDSAPDARSVGHVTDLLKIVDGNWQIIYRHESRA